MSGKAMSDPTPSGLERYRFDIGLEDLQTFLAVAELGSFSRAAEQLNLSQPSISNRVRRLEEKLLVRLLDRNTRRVELTPTGRRLYLQSSETLRSLRTLLQDLNREAITREREVRVAATLMVATVGLPQLLKEFNAAHPSISVSVHDLTPTDALEQVGDGRCDLAVMALMKDQPRIAFEPLISDTCVVVTSHDHPLLQHAGVPLALVLDQPLLSIDGHVDLRSVVMAEAASRGLSVRLAPEARGVSNVFTLLAMAAVGLGVCIHPRSLVPIELEPALGVVPLADCEIVRTFGVVTSQDRPLSPAARRFRDFLRSFVAGGEETWPWRRKAAHGTP